MQTSIKEIEGAIAENVNVPDKKQTSKTYGDRIPLWGICALKEENKRKHGKDFPCKTSKHS
jgi:hypothetical protein